MNDVEYHLRVYTLDTINQAFLDAGHTQDELNSGSVGWMYGLLEEEPGKVVLCELTYPSSYITAFAVDLDKDIHEIVVEDEKRQMKQFFPDDEPEEEEPFGVCKGKVTTMIFDDIFKRVEVERLTTAVEGIDPTNTNKEGE